MKYILSIAIYLLCLSIIASNNYYVSPLGNDSNEGSLSNPFLTIQKASSVMVSGDICFIRAGVYRETLLAKTDGITYENYNNEFVLITGCDVVSQWVDNGNGIAKATMTKKTLQLFVDGTRMNLARYPNEDGDMYSKREWAATETKAPTVTGVDTAEVVLGQTFPNDYWKGGYYIGLNSRVSNAYSAAKGRIFATSGNALKCDALNYYWKNNGDPCVGVGKGYVINHLNALDIPTEWYCKADTTSFSLYFMPPVGKTIDQLNVEARTRIYGIDLSNRANVLVKGINVKAASVILRNSTFCTVDSCTVRYPAPFAYWTTQDWGQYQDGSFGVYLSGSDNIIKNTYIARSWFNCLTVDGLRNTVNNCLIEESNWIGQRSSLILAIGNYATITNNTLRVAGRDGIDMGNNSWIARYGKYASIKNNKISDVGQLDSDCGAFYTNHQGAGNPLANTEIANNYFSVGTKSLNARVGIYVDNSSSGYLIHHNIIDNCGDGFRPNLQGIKNQFYNNTIVNCASPTARWISATNIDCKAYNNIFNNLIFGIPDQHTNYVSNNLSSQFSNEESYDYSLKSGSGAIDFGTSITGITDGFSGTAPDAGAVEFGTPMFSFGSTLQTPYFEDEQLYSTTSRVAPSRIICSNNKLGTLTIKWESIGIIHRVKREKRDGNVDFFMTNGNVFIDNSVEPGVIYTYQVAVDNNGVISSYSQPLQILALSNTITDPMGGRDYQYDSSPNWLYPTGSAELFDGDGTRNRRLEGIELTDATRTAFVVWELTKIEDFSAKMYRLGAYGEVVNFSVSTDGKIFTPIPTTFTTLPGGGWTRYIYTNQSPIPVGNRFLKMQISSGSNNGTPQVCEVKINSNLTTINAPSIDKESINVCPSISDGKIITVYGGVGLKEYSLKNISGQVIPITFSRTENYVRILPKYRLTPGVYVVSGISDQVSISKRLIIHN